MKRSVIVLCILLAHIGAAQTGQDGAKYGNRTQQDIDAERALMRQIYKNPEEHEILPKFVKAPAESAAGNRWHVEFTIDVTNDKQSEELLEEIARSTGATIWEKINHKFSRGGWIDCDEATAERISLRPDVRRVRQDAKLNGGGFLWSNGKEVKGGGVPIYLDPKHSGVDLKEPHPAKDPKAEPREKKAPLPKP